MNSSAGREHLGPVRSVAEYVEAVTVLNNSWASASPRSIWYRGHSSKSYTLLPTIHRGTFGTAFERDMSRDFRLMAPTLLTHLPRTELSWMFVMQHYGLPTRLLDWTASHLVALFFAVEDHQADTTPVVWVLRPGKLNLASIGEVTIASEPHPGLSDYLLDEPHLRRRRVNGTYAIAVRPELNSPRIVAQRGGFTLHGARAVGLETIVEELAASTGVRVPLATIEIEPGARHSIIRELSQAGITHSVVFPELQGIAMELRQRYSDLYVSAEDVLNLN